MAYDGERADALVLDHLEAILRHVGDELAAWRARAIKAEAELKESGGRGAAARQDPEIKNRVGDLDQENKVLRQRVEAARLRLHDLLSRLTFLEEQARQGEGAASAGAASGAGGSGGGGGSGGSAR